MAEKREILEVPDFMTVRELSELMEVSPIDVMKQLIANGIMASINQQIDYDTAAIIIEEMGYMARPLREVEEEKRQAEIEAQRPKWRTELYATEEMENLQKRPAVVTILGHVDHGKTSLLDAIRETKVADGEAGGITQAIGAYQITYNGEKITFIDTPGHEAFTAMRSRGAQGADIAILVVAADDGVMPTTREAVDHARAAGVPILVALNKIDKANSNPEYVKQQLSSELELTPDEWGGDTLVIPVSARTREGLDNLLEGILLVAEDADIFGNPNSQAGGVVMEGRVESGRGTIATLLVQNGTLKRGDVVVAGTSYGRIKSMFNDRGKTVDAADPSTPVSVMGLNEPPNAGQRFEVVKNIKVARNLIEERLEAADEGGAGPVAAMSLEDFFARMSESEKKELLLVIKVDVYGSLEPVVESLQDLSNDEVKINILRSDVGDVSENDVNLASASGAIIIGFTVGTDSAAERAASALGVEIRTYNIIYKLIEDVELALKGMLDPVYEDKKIGAAEVRQIFRISKVGNIAGSYVLEGIIRRNAQARVLRRGKLLAENLSVTNLKRVSEDVREVRAGFECGISLDKFDAFEEGDVIEFTVRERVN